jgi:pyochelin synthetase
MGDTTKLLEDLAQLGVKVAADDGQLKLSAVRGVLTDELRQRVQASRDEIVRRLQAVGPEGADRTPVRIAPQPQADGSPFPLSDLQLGFYIANDPYMDFHVRPHCYMELDRDGLDPAAYEAAWNQALRRHRRELCTVSGDMELQLLPETPRIECQVYDWRGLPSGEVAQRLLRVREEMMRQELRLDAWPWLDLRVSRWRELGQEKARIHYNHNNYFIDGFGATQLLAEIDGYYREPGSCLPPLELSYRDAMLGLERLAASPQGEAAKRYWFSRLAGLPPPPAVPMKPGVSRRCRSRLCGREGHLERPLWEAFKSRAGALGLTPSSAVIAAYACVLATWSNADHFILSQMVTRRFAELHPDLPRMLGNFASLYPLEIRLSPAASFVDNARRIQEQVFRDVKHLQFGGMRVLQELNRLKGDFGTAPNPFVVGSGLMMSEYRKADFCVLETSQTVLDHQFFELADGSHHYVWDLLPEFFPDGMIDAMWSAHGDLLRRLAADGEAWQQPQLDLAPASDPRQRQARHRRTRPLPDTRLHDFLQAPAAARGDCPVLVSAQGALRYRELGAWSAALAAELAAQGVGRGDLVPIVMHRDQELPAAVMAVLRAGAAYVPVDPQLPAERFALLLEEAGCRLALTQPGYERTLEWPPGVAPIRVVSPAAPGAGGPPAGMPEGAAGSAADLAYVIYTSGSTGRPKGVMIDHRAAVNTILDVNERFAIGPADRLFGVSAFNFDLSVYDLFGAVAAGACLVYPHPEAALDPAHWLALVRDEDVTVWSSVPALMSLLVEAAERRQVALPSLRLVLLSGDKIPLDLPPAIRRIAPNAGIVSLGGATEASIWSIVYPIAGVDPAWSTIPYGYPMTNQSWDVRDRNGRPCPTWVPGELFIGGAGLALGYWRDAEKTSRSFGLDPLTGERLYRTGDRGRYLPDGCIEWLGRVDFQVKVQGQRIELGEIEAALAEHPAVRQAVVAVQEPPAARRRRLVGYVVPAADSRLDAGQLESFLRRKLPAHMVPAAWQLLAELPLTDNGKVDRKALLQAQIAEQRETAGTPARVAPQDAVESRLRQIWRGVLEVPELGVTDDFFALGGQSFDAIRIFARIKEEFGRAYTLSDMWRARTIRALAAGIDGRQPQAAPGRVVGIDLEGRGEPLFLVHPAGGSVMTYARLGTLIDRPLYGIQAALGGDDGGRRRDVVELARVYVAELRQVQEHGPYSLGGWSSGAMIAFEMAAQLEAAGEKVTQVFILDGPAPVSHEDLSDERLLLWFLEDLALGLPVERLKDRKLSGRTLAEQLREASALVQPGNAPALDLEGLAANFEVFRDLIGACSRYRPKTIAADLTVVRVEQDVVDEFAAHPCREASDWGWRGLTSGQVRCARVPGTHHSFLREPLVGSWCGLLSEAGPAAVPWS